jgi:cytoskeletal protein RodZ
VLSKIAKKTVGDACPEGALKHRKKEEEEEEEVIVVVVVVVVVVLLAVIVTHAIYSI